MKLYVVTAGEYSAYHIVAAFSSQDRAQQYVDKAEKLKMYDWETMGVEEYELDQELYDTNYLWVAYEPLKNTVKYSTYYGAAAEVARQMRNNVFYFGLPAHIEYTNQDLLLKIAQDEYAKYKAEQEIF